MKHLLFLIVILLIACSSPEKKKPKAEDVEVKKVESIPSSECALFVNETKINLTLFITENNLNDQFQIFAGNLIPYLEKHIFFDLHSNEIVNRNVNLSRMKKHIVYLDEIMAPFLSKKDRIAVYTNLGKVISLTKCKVSNDEEMFDTLVVQRLTCCTAGTRDFLKRYDNEEVAEEVKNAYRQESIEYVDIEALLGKVIENNSYEKEKPKETNQGKQKKPKETNQGKQKKPKETNQEEKSNYDITENESVQKISETSKNKVENKVEDTISNSIDSFLGNE